MNIGTYTLYVFVIFVTGRGKHRDRSGGDPFTWSPDVYQDEVDGKNHRNAEKTALEPEPEASKQNSVDFS
jgi:hypothetical protein